jgi:hypothetical protein
VPDWPLSFLTSIRREPSCVLFCRSRCCFLLPRRPSPKLSRSRSLCPCLPSLLSPCWWPGVEKNKLRYGGAALAAPSSYVARISGVHWASASRHWEHSRDTWFFLFCNRRQHGAALVEMPQLRWGHTNRVAASVGATMGLISAFPERCARSSNRFRAETNVAVEASSGRCAEVRPAEACFFSLACDPGDAPALAKPLGRPRLRARGNSRRWTVPASRG